MAPNIGTKRPTVANLFGSACLIHTMVATAVRSTKGCAKASDPIQCANAYNHACEASKRAKANRRIGTRQTFQQATNKLATRSRGWNKTRTKTPVSVNAGLSNDIGGSGTFGEKCLGRATIKKGVAIKEKKNRWKREQGKEIALFFELDIKYQARDTVGRTRE